MSDDSHTGVLPPGCSPVQTLKGCASRMVASSAGAARPCTCDRPAIKAHLWLPPCARCLDANSLRDRLFAGVMPWQKLGGAAGRIDPWPCGVAILATARMATPHRVQAEDTGTACRSAGVSQRVEPRDRAVLCAHVLVVLLLHRN